MSNHESADVDAAFRALAAAVQPAFSRLVESTKAMMEALATALRPVVAGFVDLVRSLVSLATPTTTDLIDALGITEADIRSVRYVGDGQWEVRLWNHRRLLFSWPEAAEVLDLPVAN